MKFLLILQAILCRLVFLPPMSSVDFNREFTGVSFNPYVKSANPQRLASCLNQYTLQEVKTMLKVVSTKFSRVATNTVDAANVTYVPNATYYNHACIVARTAEAAALINRERHNKSLTVLIGVEKYSNEQGGDQRTLTEAQVALEAEEIANRIYPGTVEGLHVAVDAAHFVDRTLAASALKWTTYLKNQTMGKGLQIGMTGLPRGKAFSASDLLYSDLFNFDSSRNKNPELKTLIENTDFIIVKYYVNAEQTAKGPIESASYYVNLFLTFGPLVRRRNPKMNIMASSGWPSGGNLTFYTIDNLVKYWKAMDELATRKNFTVWLEQAFDNPFNAHYDQDFPYYGWWRLTRDDLAGEKSGYVEKYLEKREGQPIDLFWLWIGIGVSAGVIVILLLIGFVINIYKKVSSLEEALTKEEINEFKYGRSEFHVSRDGEDDVVCGSAMRKPYDQSLEIPKDMLEIYWDQILGTGQFGCVFKALWKTSTPKEIALKTTKQNCPATALRGIMSEIKILAHLGQHPNIVSICGAYTAKLSKGKVYVATELCTMGSLKSYLVRLNMNAGGNSNYVNVTDHQQDMMRWCIEIASGMEHLGNMGVIHADLAARNVLLSREAVAKISDFGLSRRLYDYSNYVKQQQEPLPWRSMAIESLKMMMFSHQSDVWSYGVTLWEIFSLGVEPYPGLSWSADFVDRLEDGLRMTKPNHATPEMYDLMTECWQAQPDMRPSFSEIKMKILNIRNKEYVDVAEVCEKNTFC